jgi:hypothetical protein
MLARTIAEWRQWTRAPGDAAGMAGRGDPRRDHAQAVPVRGNRRDRGGTDHLAARTCGSQRNWDYRYCWIRDAYYTIQALNRLGALDVLEGYLEYLRNVVEGARGGISSRSMAGRRDRLTERVPRLPAIAAWARCAWATRPMSRSSTTPMARSSCATRRPSSTGGSIAWPTWPISKRWKPWASAPRPRHADAGLGAAHAAHVHTYSAAMCWAACDRLANIATVLGLPKRADFWQARRCQGARNRSRRAPGGPKPSVSATFGGDDLDASLIQLLDMRFLPPDDPRFQGTLRAVEEGLRRGSHMLRYASEDDFGLPETAFNVCTFWLIEALHATGRASRGRALLEEMLTGAPPPGCCPKISTRLPGNCGAITPRPTRWSA